MRVLSDPTFDPPGRRYSLGWGTSSPNPSNPPASYLPSQSWTVLRCTPNRAATDVTVSPPLITANTA